MLILLDHNTPAPLRYALKGHVVVEAVERGWERLLNGVLLETAEEAGFELFVTADKNISAESNGPENRYRRSWKCAVACPAAICRQSRCCRGCSYSGQL